MSQHAQGPDQMRDYSVFRVPASAPDDISGLRKLLQDGTLAAEEIVAIIAQTEGWTYSRGYASLSLQRELARHLDMSAEDVFDQIPLMMIGMVGGLMSPHFTIFARQNLSSPNVIPQGRSRLAIGTADTAVLAPEDYGTELQVDEVAEAVRQAVADAQIESLEDVSCVEVKCPAMTVSRLQDARRRGAKCRSTDLITASSLSRGASALGVAVALGEVSRNTISTDSINNDDSLFTERGSVSAGGEQSRCRVMVMGNSGQSVSRYRIGHGVMADQLDIGGIMAALRRAGVSTKFPITADQQRLITQVFVNCGADAVEEVRGRRHTMNTDFLAHYAGIFAKSIANAVVASVVGDTMILASAGSEHQGQPGSNLVAVIAEVAS